MKKVLVSGSIAYDYIMNFDNVFKDVLLKKNLGNLNVSFTGKNKKMHFGGCGANICYAISLFGIKPVLFGVAGKDFDEYSARLKTRGINIDYVGIDKNGFTANATIITDKKENQITVFSPGAMENIKAEKQLDSKILKNLKYAILSPDICERSARIAKILIKNKVPYFFDPGQMIHVFNLKELKFLLNNSYGFIANSYEIKLLCSRLKITKNTITKQVPVVIETLAEKGLLLFEKGVKTKIPACRPKKIVDPTGCGDAFRGGFLAGLMKKFSLKKACITGAKIAARKIATHGTQNY